jgi:hypothetical protein
MDVIAVDNAFNCPTTDEDVGIPVAFADLSAVPAQAGQVNLMIGNPILHTQLEEQPITMFASRTLAFPFTKFTLERSEGFSGQVGLWEEIHERILKVKQRILKVEQKILEVEQMTKARYNS